MWIIKTIGLVMIFLVCALIGILRSSQIRSKTNNLKILTISLKQLAEYIRCDGGDLENLIHKCFPQSVVYFENKKIHFDPSSFDTEISDILQEFLSSLGKKDRFAEYERTLFYARLFENRLQSAEEKSRELCRLYNTLGVLFGIFICIFFL